jgi:hypothetical protein
MKRLIVAAALLLIVPAMASAQNANPPYRGQGYFFFGLGTWTPSYVHPVIKQVGFGGEGFLYKGLGVGAEASYASWRTHSTAWIGSGDFSYHFRRNAARLQVDPFVLGGVSIVGPTEVGGGRGSPAGNFGGGANLWLAQHAALRFDFRDVVGASFWGYSHVIAFRIGMTFR